MSAPDPIIAATEGHRLASAAYDEAVDRWSAHEHDPIADEENHTAFSHLEKSWRALVSAEFKTLGGLVALLEYMAPRLQEEDAPAMLLENLVDDQEWSTVFGLFCANLARGLAAIMAAQSAVTPEFVDWVADDIIAATGDLFDDYDVVRLVARAAIQADAEYRAGRRS